MQPLPIQEHHKVQVFLLEVRCSNLSCPGPFQDLLHGLAAIGVLCPKCVAIVFSNRSENLQFYQKRLTLSLLA